MLTTIHITVRDRVPTITAGEDVISHNSDYVAEFEFDEEWKDKVNTVYFVCEDGSYQTVVMSGNSCGVPMLDGEHRRIFVGVQAGAAEKPSVLKTTRPCCLKVKDSIADYLGQPIPDPTPDVYQQIIAMLDNITSPTWNEVKGKPFESLSTNDFTVDENGVVHSLGGGGESGSGELWYPTVTDGVISWTKSAAETAPEPADIRGPQGKQGEQGIQGEQGLPGTDGQNGVTPTIGDNGNWYLGDTDTGKPSRGEAGPAGANGADGHTPVRGMDYWTEKDQQAIVDDVLATLPTWEGGGY